MDKMKIFISWSGPRSAAVAEVFKEYLPMINNAFDPWLSSEDIPKGSRSTGEIADALANARAGIICLTPNNLTAPWILFEGGGIAKTVTEKPLACTLLIGLEPSEVSKPLGDFQHTRLMEKELLQLVRTLNKALGNSALPEPQVEKTFDVFWPKLKEKLDLNKLPPDGPTDKAKRTPEDLLAEILDTLRSTSQQESAHLTQLADAMSDASSQLARLIFLTDPKFAPYSFSFSSNPPTGILNPEAGILVPGSIPGPQGPSGYGGGGASISGKQTPLPPEATRNPRGLRELSRRRMAEDDKKPK